MAKNGMRPIHPGEVLREDFIVPLGMSASALARELHVPTNRITALLHEERAVTAETAMRLARYFGTTPEFWLNLQQGFDLRAAQIRCAKQVEREVRTRSSSAA